MHEVLAKAGVRRLCAEKLQVAPDLPEVDRRDVAAVALRSGIDGLIVSNTTMLRPQLVADHPCGHEVRLLDQPALPKMHFHSQHHSCTAHIRCEACLCVRGCMNLA